MYFEYQNTCEKYNIGLKYSYVCVHKKGNMKYVIHRIGYVLLHYTIY